MNRQMKKSMVVAAISLALTSVQAEAANNKDKYKDVIVYGEVTLEQDSMKEWGPWEQFIQPAAGVPIPPPVAAITPDPIPEIRKPEPPEPPVPPVESFCEGGEWCGYTALGGKTFDGAKRFVEYDDEAIEESIKEAVASMQYNKGPKSGPVSGRLELFMSSDIGVYGSSVSYQTTNPAFTSPANDYAFIIGVPDGDGGYDRVTYVKSDVPLTLDDFDGNSATFSESLLQNTKANYGYAFMGIIRNYVIDATYDEGEITSNKNMTFGGFVAGLVTKDSVINDINATFATEGMTADYYGETFGNYGNSDYSDVHIEVTFGNNASWSGTWNGGSDGNVRLDTYTNGDYVSGEVGLIVTDGTFSGSDLIASGNQITANDGIINSGTVDASFYGPDGQNIGGVVDVVKSTEGYDERQYVDVFIVQAGTDVN